MQKRSIALALAALAFTGAGCTGASQTNTTGTKPGSDRIPISDTVQGPGAIRLTSPQEGQVLKSPFLVGGEADALAGGVVYVRVKNPAGDVVISEETRVPEGGGPFGVLISFVFQATDRGTVEVYGIDPGTGAEVALESVGVNFDTSAIYQ
ncbi:MAG: hypothetical protein HYT31_01885 [Parcubacteria group bacterium]|nr:hypothetical protein [Parcubacteria group bacterium]